MKYFIVSDIHGAYDKLINALNEAGFNSETDTLVSVGDAFDRGTQNRKVLDYFLELPHKILLWGNHDARLYRLIEGFDYLNWCDDSNGTCLTIEELADTEYETYTGLNVLRARQTEYSKKIQEYFNLCRMAIEFPDMYVTHGWLPFTEDDQEYHIHLVPDWKHNPRADWYEALWSHTEHAIRDNAFPDKTLLVGHWHAFRIAKVYGEDRKKDVEDFYENGDMSMFISPDKKLIAIDGCTCVNAGKVNVYVYETDQEPIIYKGRVH